MSAVVTADVSSHPASSSRFQRNEQWWAWAFAAPAVALGSIFILLPFLMAIAISFTNQRLITAPNLPTRFIGLLNYEQLVSDPDFWRALSNTALFVVVVVPVQATFALLLAMLINRSLPGVNVFRGTFFVPVVLPMVVVATVWSFLYTYDQSGVDQGLVNNFLQLISLGHLGPYWWTGDPNVAMLAIIILSIWQGVGFQMIIFLAGLQEIPMDLYEAANVDGASLRQQFWFITLPQLRNTLVFIVLTTTILAFGLFDQVNILTHGGPLNATTTLTFFMITKGFNELRVGYGSSVAVAFFILVVVVTLVMRRFVTAESEVK